VKDIGTIDDFEGYTHVVIGNEDSDPAILEMSNQLAYVGHRDRIDTGQRLVEEDEMRLRCESAGDLAASALTAGQRHRRGSP